MINFLKKLFFKERICAEDKRYSLDNQCTCEPPIHCKPYYHIFPEVTHGPCLCGQFNEFPNAQQTNAYYGSIKHHIKQPLF